MAEKRGRGRPKGAKNKKTLEKEALEQLDFEPTSDGESVSEQMQAELEPIEEGSIKEKVLEGPDVETRGRPKGSKTADWAVNQLPRNPSVVEILNSASKLKKSEKIALLSQYTGRSDVVYCLKAAFDPRVVFTLPAGLPDNAVIGDRETPDGAYDLAPERLIRVYKRMQYWVEGGSGQAKPAKREEIFLDTLRSLEKSEAEFLNAIRDKKMPIKGITKEICEESGFDLSPK